MPRIKISCILICISLGISPVKAEINRNVVSGPVLMATTTKPSVGHRPTPPYSELRLASNTNWTITYSGKVMFPGWKISQGSGLLHYDPDVKSYGGKESYILKCSFFFVDRKNNVAKDLTVIKTPCDYSLTIERKHVGHKLRFVMVSETDPNSVAGYTPVPLNSLEGRAFETGYILDTPSPSNSTVSIDKNTLSPGETATVTMVLRDINNNPLEIPHILDSEATTFPAGWRMTDARPTGRPGEYIGSVTYTGGGPGSALEFSPIWTYSREILHPRITINRVR